MAPSTTRTKQRPFTPYTTKELRVIREMIEQGASYDDMARRLGNRHSPASIRTTIWRQGLKKRDWRNIEQKTLAEVLEARRERMIFLHEQGVTVGELARVFDLTPAAVTMVLNRAGIDTELRELVKKAFPIGSERMRQIARKIETEHAARSA